jgi:hypothetical protein
VIARASAASNGWVAQLAEQWTENPRVGGSIPPPANSLLCELGDKLRPNFLAVLLIEPLLVLIRFGEVHPRPFGRIDPHSHKMRMRRCPGVRLTSALKITIDDNRFTLCGRAA